MKILLLIPPIVYKRQPSIGIAYLSSYLRSNGYTVQAWDLNTEIKGINDGDDGYWAQEANADKFIAENMSFFEKFLENIMDYNPDIIGFNVWATSRKQSLLLAEMIKKRDSSKLIIFGGPEAVLGDNLFIS